MSRRTTKQRRTARRRDRSVRGERCLRLFLAGEIFLRLRPGQPALYLYHDGTEYRP